MSGADISGGILEYLKERGILQRWLATKVGMDESMLSRKLHGKSKLYADEYKVICDALMVDYDKFMGHDEGR